MKESFIKILNEYLKEKENSFKENQLANFITKECPKIIYDTKIINKNQYIITGSASQGNWASIPWIGIFDKDITTTAQKGYYIVYLFSADMKKVYLSLNQGWTEYKNTYGMKNAKEKIKIVAQIWKDKLKSVLDEFSFESINLEYKGKSSDLPLGYELGNICSKEYSLNDIPEKEDLAQDLQNMISLYRELKGNMIDNDFISTNNYLLSENIVNPLMDKTNRPEEKNEHKAINNIIATEGQGSKITFLDKFPDVKKEETKKKNNLNNQQTNYTDKNIKQEKLGKAGEFFVINYEQNKLKELKINRKVEHIAVTQNDMAGYDIKSYNEKNEEIYIEVKTTKGNINTPFYITKKELEFSEENKDKYYLYRLYNFNSKEKTSESYVLKGDISENINLEAENYKTNGMKNNDKI